MIIIKILEVLQLLSTLIGAYFTPMEEVAYGFIAFAIGCLDATMHLLQLRSVTNNTTGPETNMAVSISETIHDYAAVGLINIELYRLSSRHSFISLTFCIPMILDVVAKLFGDLQNIRALVYLKQMNMMAHSISIAYLAKTEFNLWFGGVWLATQIVNFGIYHELPEGYWGREIKLFGYALFYIFSTIAIYDEDFLKRLEWFNIGAVTA